MRRLLLLLLLPLWTTALAAGIQPRVVGGHVVQDDPYPWLAGLMQRDEALTAAGRQIEFFRLEGSAAGQFEGALVDCGQGTAPCTGATGRVCLLQRGSSTFASKVQHCVQGGGVAAIIYNNYAADVGLIQLGEGGWTLGGYTAPIPALGISQSDGLFLLQHLGETVLLTYSDAPPAESFCGGTYLGNGDGDGWVVTAAHCVTDPTPDPAGLSVYLGSDPLNTRPGHRFGVRAIIVHEAFDPDTLDNDIALLRLAGAPQGIPPAPLITDVELDAAVAARTDALVLGRGMHEARGPDEAVAEEEAFDPQVYAARVPLVPRDLCNTDYRDYYRSTQGTAPALDPITAHMICAGSDGGGVGTCQGDSGGPLLVSDATGQPRLAGLTSWGIGCAVGGLPGVYTRVPSYAADIDAILHGVSTRLGHAAVRGDSGQRDPGGGGGGGGPVDPALLLLLGLTILLRPGRATAGPHRTRRRPLP